jgi:hypothetical protein
LLFRFFAVLSAVTSDGYVRQRDVARLDCNSGELSLALVLLAVLIVVVTNLESLQVLCRPRSMEVVDTQVDCVFIFKACGDLSEFKL